MTQEKMRRIITACVSAATLLLTCLSIYLAYQWITIAVFNHRIEKLEAENAALEQQIAEDSEYAEYLETPIGKDWLAFEEGFVRENQ
ncbi:MAG: hypothetical protein IJX49_05690 [Clostridia bacterium]|nr:hypothetical protein [Clostridia bacterium]